jgi:hypothetical protein
MSRNFVDSRVCRILPRLAKTRTKTTQRATSQIRQPAPTREFEEEEEEREPRRERAMGA